MGWPAQEITGGWKQGGLKTGMDRRWGWANEVLVGCRSGSHDAPTALGAFHRPSARASVSHGAAGLQGGRAAAPQAPVMGSGLPATLVSSAHTALSASTSRRRPANARLAEGPTLMVPRCCPLGLHTSTPAGPLDHTLPRSSICKGGEQEGSRHDGLGGRRSRQQAPALTLHTFSSRIHHRPSNTHLDPIGKAGGRGGKQPAVAQGGQAAGVGNHIKCVDCRHGAHKRLRRRVVLGAIKAPRLGHIAGGEVGTERDAVWLDETVCHRGDCGGCRVVPPHPGAQLRRRPVAVGISVIWICEQQGARGAMDCNVVGAVEGQLAPIVDQRRGLLGGNIQRHQAAIGVVGALQRSSRQQSRQEGDVRWLPGLQRCRRLPRCAPTGVCASGSSLAACARSPPTCAQTATLPLPKGVAPLAMRMGGSGFSSVTLPLSLPSRSSRNSFTSCALVASSV